MPGGRLPSCILVRYGAPLFRSQSNAGGLWIEGYEMLKGLEGVKSHTHREWLPIIENDQDMARLAGVVAAKLAEHPNIHGFLLRRHGLYTWVRVLNRQGVILKYWSSCWKLWAGHILSQTPVLVRLRSLSGNEVHDGNCQNSG